MEEGPSYGVTRRQFVGRGGAVIGALGLVSVGWPAARLAAAAPTEAGLTRARAATYAALLEALALASEAGVTDVDRAARAMDGWYASAPDSTRGYIDWVLDSLETEGPRSFTGMRAPERLAHLRAGVARHGDELVPAAIVLAAPVVEPDTDTPAPSPHYLRP